jgi:hypothetical protein
MQDDISQTAQPIQAGPVIQIGQQRYCPGGTPGV